MFSVCFCITWSGVLIGIGGLSIRSGMLSDGCLYLVIGNMMGILGGYLWGRGK